MARAIMVSDHVYGELTELKKEGDSYTKVIDRLIHAQAKKDILQFAGAWKDLNKKDLDLIEKEAVQARKTPWRKVERW